MTQQDARGQWGQTERASARFSGEGRVVTQADSQPPSMRTDDHQASPRCHISLTPKSLCPTMDTPNFHNLYPCTLLRCRIRLHINTPESRFCSFSLGGFQRQPQCPLKRLHFSMAHFRMLLSYNLLANPSLLAPCIVQSAQNFLRFLLQAWMQCSLSLLVR